MIEMQSDLVLTLDCFYLPPAECLTEMWKGDTSTDEGTGSDDTDEDAENGEEEEAPTHDAGEL